MNLPRKQNTAKERERAKANKSENNVIVKCQKILKLFKSICVCAAYVKSDILYTYKIYKKKTEGEMFLQFCSLLQDSNEIKSQ